MSVKLKFFVILILSVFATAAAGFYMMQHQTAMPIVENINIPQPPQQLSSVQQTQEVVEDLERAEYKNIPLENINSPVQGSDPKTLAVNFLDDVKPTRSDRQIEVAYPQPHQALVMVIQTTSQGAASEVVKYRLEMNSFGRSLLSNSPPIWRIVWVGSQVQCSTTNPTPKGNSQSQIPSPKLKTPTNQAKGGSDNCHKQSRESLVQN